ncbi:MAG TPA: hypothetical protein VMA53_03430 [Stellaceae bacterium]|nr:hypothetical protein [Stellaceae bacterium]
MPFLLSVSGKPATAARPVAIEELRRTTVEASALVPADDDRLRDRTAPS